MATIGKRPIIVLVSVALCLPAPGLGRSFCGGCFAKDHDTKVGNCCSKQQPFGACAAKTTCCSKLPCCAAPERKGEETSDSRPCSCHRLSDEAVLGSVQKLLGPWQSGFVSIHWLSGQLLNSSYWRASLRDRDGPPGYKSLRWHAQLNVWLN